MQGNFSELFLRVAGRGVPPPATYDFTAPRSTTALAFFIKQRVAGHQGEQILQGLRKWESLCHSVSTLPIKEVGREASEVSNREHSS